VHEVPVRAVFELGEGIVEDVLARRCQLHAIQDVVCVPLLHQPGAGSLAALGYAVGEAGSLLGVLIGVDGVGVVGAVLHDGVGVVGAVLHDGVGVVGAVPLGFARALSAQVADGALVAPLFGFFGLDDCTQCAQDVSQLSGQRFVGESG